MSNSMNCGRKRRLTSQPPRRGGTIGHDQLTCRWPTRSSFSVGLRSPRTIEDHWKKLLIILTILYIKVPRAHIDHILWGCRYQIQQSTVHRCWNCRQIAFLSGTLFVSIGGREAVLSTFIYLKCEFSMWKMSTKRGSNDPNLGQLLWTLGNYCLVRRIYPQKKRKG